MGSQIITGTWEEIRSRDAELQGRRVALIVIDEMPSVPRPDGKRFYETATAEEFETAFDAIAQGNEELPILTAEAFERELLYEEQL